MSSRHPTPEWPLELPESVYPPSEDTFLLIDSLESQQEQFSQLHPQIAVEVGCGSGIVISFFKKYLAPDCRSIASDINPEALLTAKVTASMNNVFFFISIFIPDYITPPFLDFSRILSK